MSDVNVYLLGPPRIERDGAVVHVDTRKAIALVAYLATMGGGHRRDSLAALLWPEGDERRARAALRRTLSSLNGALQGQGLIIERESVALDATAGPTVDIVQFRSLIAQRLAHGHPANEVCKACLEPSAGAVGLYRQDFLSGFTLRDSPDFDDWQQSQQERIRREFAGALQALMRCHSAAGQFEHAIECARRWVDLDPLSELSHQELMKAYGWTGQRASAQGQYRECVRVLEQELGVSPLDETTQLYRAIMEDAGPRPPVFAPEHATLSSPTNEVPSPEPAAFRDPAARYPLVGREDEWNRLIEDYEGIRDHGHLVVIEGESGVGKTRIAEEFLSYLQGRGAATLSARCYEGESTLAYSPLVSALGTLPGPERSGLLDEMPIEWLSEVSRLLPKLRALRDGVTAPQPLDTPGAQIRFYEAMAHFVEETLRGPRPGILFIDDLQWADEASVEWLAYFARRLKSHPLMVLLTRRGDVVPSAKLQLLLAEARRPCAAITLELGRLDYESTVALARAAAGGAQPLPEGFEVRLYRETEGLPLFLVEYMEVALRALRDDEPEAVQWEIPGRVRELWLSRVSALSQTAAQILETAAVIGRQFAFDAVQQASGRGEDEAAAAMDELVRSGLVEEVDPRGAPYYDFEYDQLRALAYDNIGLARRRLLHRRVAEALESAISPSDRGAAYAAIGRHYQLAGKDLDAAESFRQAGEYERSLYANVEARNHLRTALELGHHDSRALQEAMGDVQILLGEFGAALTAYEASAALSGPESLGRVERKIGGVHHRRGDWTLAEKHYESAAALLETDASDGESARLYADWSLTAHRMGHVGRPRELAQRAADLAEASGDVRSVAQAHNIMGVLARNEGDYKSAHTHLSRSLELAGSLDDRSLRIAALNNMALAHRAEGEPELAIDLTIAGLELCNEQGDRHRQAALHNNLADLYHSVGRPDDARSELEEAVKIFSEIGAEAGEMLPEVWMLVEW